MLAHGRRMHALEFEGELLPSDRPTIPVPRPEESGVRLGVSRVAFSAATLDVVVCDLTRDPRSEDYVPRAALRSGFFPARCTTSGRAKRVDQNEQPPATSAVRVCSASQATRRG